MYALVWVLASFSNTGAVGYSPPLYSLEECTRVKAVVEQSRPVWGNSTQRCIQMRIYKEGK
jgi:hypothetical protein